MQDLLDNFEMGERQIRKTDESYNLKYDDLLVELLAEEVLREIDKLKLNECLTTIGTDTFPMGSFFYKIGNYIGQDSIKNQLDRFDRPFGSLYYIRLKHPFPEIMKLENYV